MNLRERLASATGPAVHRDLFNQFGVMENPYPAAGQTSENPHLRKDSDDEIDSTIESFVRDHKSQVVVIEGTQGTGKTNVLNFYEREIRAALESESEYYVVRYLSDPEASFDSTLRRLIQEFGVDRLVRLSKALAENEGAIENARSHEVRVAFYNLAHAEDPRYVANQLHQWLLGLRLLKSHKEALGVNFRLDTVESKTAALRDLVQVSSSAKLLSGIFLLMDELEKQDGVLSATAVVRYLSAMRAIIDALPNHLFMMIAVTPDALRRYSAALPAFRSRLENRIELHPLSKEDEAVQLATFYFEQARKGAAEKMNRQAARAKLLLSTKEIETVFANLFEKARRAGDAGLRHREFLHELHELAEEKIHALPT